MLHDLAIVILALVACFAMTYRKRKQLEKKALLLEPFREHFKESNEEYLSIHQYVLKSSGHQNLKYLCGIITLKRDFCLSYLMTTVPRESLILTGRLKARTPCVYIFRKTLSLKHYGLKYAKKSLVANIPGYKVFGSPEEKHVEFARKYELSTFYISYAPMSIEDPHDFESDVFLRASPSILSNKEFADDFMALFNSIRPEVAKRALELRQGYNRDVEKLRAKEKLSFGEQLVSHMREKSKAMNKN